MKHISTFKFFAALAFAGMFAACSSDDLPNEAPQTPLQISVAKSADFKITSGGRTLTESISTRAGVDGELLFFKKADCPDAFRMNFPAQKLYKPECDYVYQCIKEDAELIAAGDAPKYEKNLSDFVYKTFYIVNAYSAKDHDAKGDHSDVAGDMHDLGINGVYVTEFNTNTCIAANLIIADNGLKDVTYDDSFGTKRENYTVSNWKLFYIPGEEYGWYIGMDYGTNKFGYEPDGEYSDWVIKVIPAKPFVDPIIDETDGEVEVNLSINDEHVEGDYVATKTSIHVRALTDVDILLPIDKKFYCEADDMDISLSHRDYNVRYNTDPRQVQMNIGGKIVTFSVSYEDAGIRITTKGICREVIDFCRNMYYDGITFEVWNYFKDITRADLKDNLDKSTVTFTTGNPKTYVNAFAKLTGYAEPIYNKFNDAGQLVPYTDSECTKPLDQKYWTRESADSKDYIFVGYQNPMDCTVTPSEPGYEPTPQDSSDPTLSNYNVIYTYKK